jgi:hypothetical protein
MSDDAVYTYDAEAQVADFPEDQRQTAGQVISQHVALRAKKDAEYTTEFQDPGTSAERKQQIRDVLLGLLPREQVEMRPEDVGPPGRSA